MKFYVHFEDPPDFTVVFKWESTHRGSLNDVLEQFVAVFNQRNRHLIKLSVSEIQVLNKKQKPLPLKSDIASAVKGGSDLFVVQKKLVDSATKKRGSPASLAQSAVCSPHIIQLLAREQERRGATGCNAASCSFSKKEGSRDIETATAKNNDGDVSFSLERILKVSGSPMEAARICTAALRNGENNAAVFSCLAQIYLNAGRPQRAMEYIDLAIRENPDDHSLNLLRGKCLSAAGSLREATAAFLKHISYLQSTKAPNPRSKIHEVKAEIAKLFVKEGNIRMGIDLFSDVLREDRHHVDSLIGFAVQTARRSAKHLHEAIGVLMSALAHSKGLHSVRRELANLIGRPGGIDVFKNQLKDIWESSESLMFLADILRDSGVIRQAIELVKRALQLSPHDPSIILYLVHTYEILSEHNKAFLEARNFLLKNPLLKFGFFSCSHLIPLLQSVTRDIYLYHSAVKPTLKFISQAEVGPVLDSELHLLGLSFTLVKIFFVSGALDLIKPLLPILDKVHASRPLHRTLLRNEAAFYSCISEVVKVPIADLPHSPKYIYFASDSHCISPAWRVVDFQAKPRVIHPLLATGVKIWHLRNEGCFYAKFSLINALKSVPNGSHVIFNIGEIDCREGMLRAVNSCKYDSLAEAIVATVDIYIDFLREQKKQRKFSIYVHPILPILTETRETVLNFNERLKEAVQACGELHWLQILDSLLIGEDNKFNSEYKLDGTHIHPKYVSLLERALS